MWISLTGVVLGIAVMAACIAILNIPVWIAQAIHRKPKGNVIRYGDSKVTITKRPGA